MTTLFDEIENDPTRGRHGGNPESAEAHESARGRKSHWHGILMRFLQSRGDEGATLDEASVKFEVPVNYISGRFTELERVRFIRRSGARRQTRSKSMAAVWVLNGELPAQFRE